MNRPRDRKSSTGHSRSGGTGNNRRQRSDRRKHRGAPSRPVRVVGIVGGIGSGKSQIAQKLSALGATVIDADSVGHALLDQGPVQELLVRRFGQDILGPSDEEGGRLIDRRALGTIVFSDESARKVLEEAMHPRMRTTFERVISRLARQVFPKPGALRIPPPVVVLDAAVLYEAGWDDLCDLIVFVDAPRKDRIRRVKTQRNWDPDEMDRRETSQWPLDLKRNQADVILKNGDNIEPEAVDKEVANIWARLNPEKAQIKPKKKVDYSQLIEDEIEVLSPDRPKPNKKPGNRPTRQPRNKPKT